MINSELISIDLLFEEISDEASDKIRGGHESIYCGHGRDGIIDLTEFQYSSDIGGKHYHIYKHRMFGGKIHTESNICQPH